MKMKTKIKSSKKGMREKKQKKRTEGANEESKPLLSFPIHHPIISNHFPIIEEARKGYYLFASRETSVSRDEPFITWIINHGCKAFLDFPNGQIYDYYLEQQSYFPATRKLADYLVSHWDEHIGTYKKRKRTLIEAARRLAKTVRTESKKIIPDRQKILFDYLKTINHLYYFGEYIFGAWAVIHILEKEVIQQFPRHIELIMSLTDPIDYIKMQKELLTARPDKIMQKYGWLKMYSSYDLPYTTEELAKLKSQLQKKEIDEQFQQFKVNKRMLNQFIATISNPQLKINIRAVNTYAFLKTDRIDTWKQAQFYLKSFHQFIADQINGCSLRNASDLTIQETMDFLTAGRFPPLNNLQLRSGTKALYFWNGQTVQIITDPALISSTKKALEGDISAVQELKGFTACPGYAKGKVKIINHSQDLKKIKEGDIFVAKYTFPTYTPFMLKCSAIITNEGGITTHAAIISREYKKPCVIGVKNATSILEDDEMVEVDADKGIIRRIYTKR